MRSKNPRAPRLTLQLSPELIEQSIPRDSSHCMLAEAVKAAYPSATRVSVDLQTIRFTDLKKHHRYTYLTPRTAQLALIHFDQGVIPEPFNCTLRGGQVTYAGTRASQRLHRAADEARPELAEPREVSEESRAANKKNSERAKLARQKLVFRQGDDTAPETPRGGKVPDRIGGAPPPSTPFARRRAFGLRALER